MNGVRLSSEMDLVREVLRVELDRTRIGAIIADSRWFVWDRFEELLFSTKIVPLAASAILKTDWLRELAPPSLVDRLLNESEKSIVRSLLREHELKEVLGHFRKGEVHCLVLKGLPLAERNYGDSSLRDVRDLDLLVPPEQLATAERLLESLGYALFELVHSRGFYRRHHFHVVYVRRRKTVDVVELHWNLLHNPFSLRVDTSKLFRRRIEGSLGGSPIELLAPLDEIVYVMASLRMSHYLSLKRLVDLDRLFHAQPSITADHVIRHAELWGMREETQAALLFLRRFWGDPRYDTTMPSRVERFASRYRGSDFFPISSGRELRFRIWSSAYFGDHKLSDFAWRLVFPDEAYSAELYYTKEEPIPVSRRVRRHLSGFISLIDVISNLIVSPFRRLH